MIAAQVLLAALLAAEPTRIAILAGRNDGAPSRTPLRYAEHDAIRVRRALIEVGGVAPDDAKLLRAPTPAQLDEALAWAKTRVDAAHATPGGKAILIVYVSAHGREGQGIELGEEVVEWDHFKQAIRATKADAKIGIVDACSASGLLGVSGKAADNFALKAEDRLTVEGEAWITSSAETEPSVEAGAWRGSVFTHHLIAGLRGAADRSGDRKVSLEELYRYAFERTTEGSTGQHPGYAFRLAGYGDLQLSDLNRAPALVTLPEGLDAVTITERDTGENLAEARHPLSRLLGLGTGRYDVRLLKGGDAWAAQIDLEPGMRLALDTAHLEHVAASPAQLVRLNASEACLKVKVPNPDARLLALQKRLEGSCAKPRGATLTHTDAGTLRLELDGQIFEAPTEAELLSHLTQER